MCICVSQVAHASVVSIGTRIQTGWPAVQIPMGAGDLFLAQNIQTGFGAHPYSYYVGTGGSFPSDI